MSERSFLDRIVAQKKVEIEHLYNTKGRSYFQSLFSEGIPGTGPFAEALSKPGLKLIAEIKKASPSKGLIRKDFDPVALAGLFEAGGAAALSVLTETQFFLGDPSYLQQIKQVTGLPLLRKDFILDPIQVYESKELGADAILLIKAILSKKQCQELLSLARSLGLDVLLELHSLQELDEVKELSGIQILGINNRDLRTFETNVSLAPKIKYSIRQSLPQSILVVAESGYSSVDQMAALDQHDFDGILVGEGLVGDEGILAYFR